MIPGQSIKWGDGESILPIWACVVCYNPEMLALERLVLILEPQVDRILLLDNSPEQRPGIGALLCPKVIYQNMPGNLGTAGALNRGWALAIAGGAGAVVSFDQDSAPTSDLVLELSRNFRVLCAAGNLVAAVGPRVVDPRSGHPARIRYPQRFFRTHVDSQCGPPIAVDHLIASGSLISTASFKIVGEFSEKLFLDYVDIEWSLRARLLGYSVYVAPGVLMNHTIGDKILRLGSHSLPIHKPYRTYLLVRNHLLLWRSPAAKLFWLLSDLRQLIFKVTILLISQPARLLRLKWILLGIWHGATGTSDPPTQSDL